MRVDLAATYRLIAKYGWDDMIFTHVSARAPGPGESFLINPYGHLFNEITASSLVKVDIEGRVIDDSPFIVSPAGFTIHSALHEGREDAGCVIHLHTRDGCAVSAQAHGLLPLTQYAMSQYGDIAYHDYEGPAVDLAERERIVRDIGSKNCLILRNHGTLTVGRTCADAFMRMYFLERACTTQIAALTAGVEALNQPNQGVAQHASDHAKPSFDGPIGSFAWPALIRQLNREDASYAE